MCQAISISASIQYILFAKGKWKGELEARDSHHRCQLGFPIAGAMIIMTLMMLREGWLYKNLSKSWHCQDWLDPPRPPPPNPGTLVDLTTEAPKCDK